MERKRRHSLTLSYRSLSCRSLYVVGRVELAGETANASLRQCAGHSESGGSSRSERDAQVNLRWRLPGSTSIQETRCWRTTSRRWPRAGTLGGAARVVDSSSSLEFERVVDARIPRSRVHLRARAARHEHAAVRKSLTSERQRLICQASMYKVHGEVFDYTEAFSRNIGLASGRTTSVSSIPSCKRIRPVICAEAIATRFSGPSDGGFSVQTQVFALLSRNPTASTLRRFLSVDRDRCHQCRSCDRDMS